MTGAEEFERDVHDEASLWAFLGRHKCVPTEALHVVSKDKAGNIEILASIVPDNPRSASVVVLDA